MRAPHFAKTPAWRLKSAIFAANNCLKTPAYANLMQILGYPPSINASSHFAAEPGIFYQRERTAKVIPNYQY